MPWNPSFVADIKSQKEKDVAIVFSCLNDRDVDEMIDEMLKAGYPVYVTTFQDERAIDLSSIAPRPHLTIVNSFIEAMQTAYIKKQHIVVTGSLHFISRVRKYLIDLQTQDTKNQ